jgi:hypothetical protein
LSEFSAARFGTVITGLGPVIHAFFLAEIRRPESAGGGVGGDRAAARHRGLSSAAATPYSLYPI